MALPSVLANVLSPGPVPQPGFGGNPTRARLLRAADRENWPDFLRTQYGLPARGVQLGSRAPTPLASGIANQFPLLNALLSGDDLGLGLNRVGSGGAMGGLAPSFTASVVSPTAQGYRR